MARKVRGEVLTVTAGTRNITRVFREATMAEVTEGREWYPRARALAEELDPTDPARGAAVLAVLSPMTPWSRNAQLARMAYAAPDMAAELPTMGDSARKAARILAGDEPDEIVSGSKVRAFWHKIADPWDARGVVIDRHAFDVAVGKVTNDATRGAHLGRMGGYDALAALYARAARILSAELGAPITPAEVQAVTWLVWRRTRVRTAAANRAGKYDDNA